MIRVTAAGAADLKALLALMIEAHADNGIFPLSIGKVVRYVQDALGRGIVLLAWQDDELVGTLIVMVGEVWYSEVPFIEEGMVFVLPKARKTTAFLRLVRRAMMVADDKGWPMVSSVVTRTELGRKGDIFRRLGFEEVGRVFLRSGKEG